MQFERAAIVGDDADLAHRLAVAEVGEDHAHCAIAPLFAPLAQREDDREQPFTLGRERVDDFTLVGRVGRALEDSAGDHFRQPVGKDVARNPEARLELLEMLQPVERAAKNQERPLLADHLYGGRDRAGQRRLLKAIDIHRLPAFAAFSPVRTHESTSRTQKTVAI